MSEHRALIEWSRSGPDFLRQQYSREHTWEFDGGVRVPASASPSVVPSPWSNPKHVDPEEAFVAAVASCHMLTWLSLAARAGFEVASYRDEAVGTMGRTESGAAWVSAITLYPVATYSGRIPSEEDAARLHRLAHEQCFIANSVRTEITVAPAT